MMLQMKRNQTILSALLASLILLGQLSAASGEATERRSLAYLPVRARHGMVASADETASKIGVDILKRGGNAVDAAVAVGLALAVTWPRAGNLGGGGFMLIRKADGTTAAIDYREIAPAGADRDMYVAKDGNLIPDASLAGYLAAGVPGTVAGLALALEKYGTLKWRDVVEPARRLAADGIVIGYPLSFSLRQESKFLERFAESRRIFLKSGKFYEEGERLKQPELAETLHRLKTYGPREFYEGRTAQLIVKAMEEHQGLITREDLKSYRAVERKPVSGNYRGNEVLTFPPPSSGGTVLIEMLNMLEQYDLSKMGHHSSDQYHLMIEAMRRAFADRAEFSGDPDFVRVPVTGLTSKHYAAELARSIDRTRATPSAEIKAGHPTQYEAYQTTHYSVVDGSGNAVANTYTLNSGYGSGVSVPGAGFLLNNEMDDFTARPLTPNQYGLIQGEANAIGPRKRPLSSMTPTIVSKDGKLLLVIGTGGGPTIITQVLQVIVNIVDHSMNIRQSIEAPRIHHQWLPDVVNYEPFGLAEDVIRALTAKGHRLKIHPEIPYLGDVEGIMIESETGIRLGSSDPRNPNARSVGY
jgi:gamma-glutamyltranspeptidase/glutathione hydrolase